MITLSINGTEAKCPSCYEELTTGTFQRIVREWDVDEPELAKRDYFKLFSILTDTRYKSIQQTPEMDQTIWNAIGWYVTQPFQFSTELPAVLQIQDKKVPVPRRAGALGTGQNIILRQLIEQSKYMEENISMAVAICMQPLYDGGKFDLDRARELEKYILQMPIYLTHPIGFFLLQTVGRTGQKPMGGWHRIQNNLKQTLKRISRSWLTLAGSANLMTCPL